MQAPEGRVRRVRARWSIGERRSTLAAAVAAAGGALAFAVVAPPYVSADEAAHVDYALQLWHGGLPVFEDGLRLQLDQGHVPPVQWTAQHPPLFYALLAPVVGPLVDGDRPTTAAFAARGVTMVLAFLTVLAAAWAARWLLPSAYRAALWAVPVVVAGGTWLLRLGGAVYNDVLLILEVTLLIGLVGYRLRTDALARWWRPAWALLLAAAALTRASGLSLALLCVAVVSLDIALRRPRDVRAWCGDLFAPVAVAVAASWWFYARNVRLTGSITGGHPGWAVEHLGRQHRALEQVLTSSTFWETSLQQYASAPAVRDDANLLLFLVPAALGAALLVTGVLRRPGETALADRLCVLLLAGAVGGILLQQALYHTTGGGANGRYLAVLALPFAVLLVAAVGPWGARPLRVAWVVGLWFVARAVELGLDVEATRARYAPAGAPGLPTWLGWCGYGLFVVAGLTSVVVGARGACEASPSGRGGLEDRVEVQRAL
ncbi:MAG: hypothetical protein IR158_05400 [Cellulomonas sp.]|uniref:hypothetical protein n=1 Tax=Cellulomonas sp. TaxID=40001 RepID=UPI0019E09D0D|nr:hypothetical protein [Cellulomonas sp.]MBF0687191.1 hypothetical protein [Cellulomonas sp.]